MKNTLVFTSLFLVYSNSSFANQAPAVVATCVACHGQNGISTSPIWPNLAGQKEAYLVKQLTSFKTGQRIDPVMNPLMTNLSEKDIADIAKYFSSLKN